METLCVIADRFGVKHTALHRAIPLASTMRAAIHYLGFVYEKGVDGADYLED